jgi:lipoate-protein ligase A
MPEVVDGEKGKGKGERSSTAAPYLSLFPFPLFPRHVSWHLLVDAAGRSGAENMALDQALLEKVEQRRDVAYLRLYRWQPPCLSFGRNEPALARYDRAAIERLGLDVVRRPTGGRAVWHDDEVTYAVAAPATALGCLRDSYVEIHRRLARALQALGARATLAPATLSPGALSQGACFAQPVGGEVLLDGRKVVGSAQVRQGDALLQHGSILLGGSQDIVARISRGDPSAPRATSLSAALGRRVAFDEVAAAIEATWLADGERWVPADRPSVRPPVRPFAFVDPAWTWRR